MRAGDHIAIFCEVGRKLNHVPFDDLNTAVNHIKMIIGFQLAMIIDGCANCCGHACALDSEITCFRPGNATPEQVNRNRVLFYFWGKKII